LRPVIPLQRALPGIADAAVIVGQDRKAAPGQVAGKLAVDPAGDGGGGIDQDGMLLGAARKKQRRAQRVAVYGRKGDIVDEDVVELSLSHRDFPPVLALGIANANSAFTARG